MREALAERRAAHAFIIPTHFQRMYSLLAKDLKTYIKYNMKRVDNSILYMYNKYDNVFGIIILKRGGRYGSV